MGWIFGSSAEKEKESSKERKREEIRETDCTYLAS
jgi:hypothetical protein